MWIWMHVRPMPGVPLKARRCPFTPTLCHTPGMQLGAAASWCQAVSSFNSEVQHVAGLGAAHGHEALTAASAPEEKHLSAAARSLGKERQSWISAWTLDAHRHSKEWFPPKLMSHSLKSSTRHHLEQHQLQPTGQTSQHCYLTSESACTELSIKKADLLKFIAQEKQQTATQFPTAEYFSQVRGACSSPKRSSLTVGQLSYCSYSFSLPAKHQQPQNLESPVALWSHECVHLLILKDSFRNCCISLSQLWICHSCYSEISPEKEA